MDTSQTNSLYPALFDLCSAVELAADDARDSAVIGLASGIHAQLAQSTDPLQALHTLAELLDEPLLLKLIRCIEVASEPYSIALACRCVEASTLVSSGIPVTTLAEAQAVPALIKCACRLYDQPQPDSTAWQTANDACHAALLATSHHERKFLLKARISGLLAKLCAAVARPANKSSLNTLKLVAVMIRSVRNSTIAGKNKDFISLFASQMKNCRSIPMLLSYAEILYFASQSMKNRVKLLDSGVVGVLMAALEASFTDGLRDDDEHEACLVLLGCVKQLVKTKKGREALVSCGGAGICERLLTRIAAHNVHTSLELPQRLQQLQTSLCTLSLRCLAARPYPLAGVPFPIAFDLNTTMTTTTNGPHHHQMSSPSNDKYFVNGSTAHRKSLTGSQHGSAARGSGTSTSTAQLQVDGEPTDNASSGEQTALQTATETATILVSDCEDDGFADELDDVELERLKPAPLSEDDDDQSQHDLLAGVSSADEERRKKLAASQEQPPEPPKTPADELQAYAEYFAEYYDGASESTCSSTSALDAQLLSHRPSQSPTTDHNRYAEYARVTKFVNRPVKIAFPDWHGAYPNLPLQPLKLFPDALRSTVVSSINRERAARPEYPRTVYSLDALVASSSSPVTDLSNDDLQRVGRPADGNPPHLLFESRFESGNLRRADQVAGHEYELFMSPDINQHGTHHQWFYFEVSNMAADVSYTFNIVNCIKNRSMFSQGMQPVLFSVVEAADGRPGFVRAGHTICYYRNQFYRPDAQGNAPSGSKSVKSPTKPPASAAAAAGGNENASSSSSHKQDAYYSIRFNVCFRHAYDVCYIAYHFPYTYTYFLTQLSMWNRHRSSELYFRLDTLTTSLAGNPLPLMTITRRGSVASIRNRPYVVLSARVHPGESNASWMMHGAIAFLLSDHPAARDLRSHFVFKIVPMLNPDGVINGSHRCSLSGQDLNRQWAAPNAMLHPEIYQTKNMLLHLTQIIGKPPLVYCDLHGHSKKSNVFMYGNNPEKSWLPRDHTVKHNYEFHELPDILDSSAPAFSLADCCFAVQRSKESTARIVSWRQLGIRRAYTIEATYAGCTQGAYAGKHVGTRELQEMGRCLCEALVELIDRPNSQLRSPNSA